MKWSKYFIEIPEVKRLIKWIDNVSYKQKHFFSAFGGSQRSAPENEEATEKIEKDKSSNEQQTENDESKESHESFDEKRRDRRVNNNYEQQEDAAQSYYDHNNQFDDQESTRNNIREITEERYEGYNNHSPRDNEGSYNGTDSQSANHDNNRSYQVEYGTDQIPSERYEAYDYEQDLGDYSHEDLPYYNPADDWYLRRPLWNVLTGQYIGDLKGYQKTDIETSM